MPFKKNVSGNPSGKPKGAKNKTTKELQEVLTQFISRNIDTLQDDYEQMQPKERVVVFEKLLKYVMPQKTAIEEVQTIDPLEALIKSGKVIVTVNNKLL